MTDFRLFLQAAGPMNKDHCFICHAPHSTLSRALVLHIATLFPTGYVEYGEADQACSAGEAGSDRVH